MQSTGWPLEILSWQLNRAYPGTSYETRVAAKGGIYPYRFALRTAPTGMAIDVRRGVVTWAAPATSTGPHNVAVDITDAAGAQTSTTWTVEVTTRGFYFVSANGSDVTGDGSRANPWATPGWANNPTHNHAPTDIVYVTAGTYPVTLELGARNGHRSPLVWLAWPGDRVVLDAGRTVAVGMALRAGDRALFQGFEWQNAREKMFWLQGTTRNVVWRNNIMRDITSVGTNNPAFIFTEDDNASRPIEGRVQYDRLVAQDNLFHTLRNTATDPTQPSPAHGAAAVLYNVQNFLFEDNEVYDIDGRCVGDKDDGYFNTYRNNVLHDCSEGGIRIENQISQGQIEVSHNLIYGIDAGIVIGWQPGYLRDVYVHHNTVVDGYIKFRWVLNEPLSGNIVVERNLISRSDGRHAYDAEEPDAMTAVDSDRVTIDRNLVWTTGSAIFAGQWGRVLRDFAAWQSAGHDAAGVNADPALVDRRLPAASPYLGYYGRDLP